MVSHPPAICRERLMGSQRAQIIMGSKGFECSIRVVVIFEVRNFLAPNPGICEVPGENHLGKIIFESVHIYPVLNDLEVSRNVI